MIGIIEYGVGNIKSVENAVKYFDASIQVDLVDDADKLKDYDKIILPGVGAFEDAMNKIRDRNFDQAIKEEADKGKHILGICLGMQLLASKSYEFGEFEGLDLIPGEVVKFESEILSIPHMGWNNVHFEKEGPLFNEIENDSDFYFVHSFHYQCTNPDHGIGSTEYGVDFTSIVNKDNVFGAQFHPEKSQMKGLQFVNNFITLS